MTYVTEIALGVLQPIRMRVDSFPLLYSLILQLYSLSGGRVFIDVGESLFVVGDSSEGWVNLKFEFHPTTFEEEKMTLPTYIWYLAQKIGELTGSMEGAGVDVAKYLQKYPPLLGNIQIPNTQIR